MSKIKQFQIGWIGLGKMGKPMAANLQEAGHQISVYNRSKDKAASLMQKGAKVHDTTKDLAKNSDTIFSMISDDSTILDIALGQEGVIENAPSNSVFVDMSTISPATSKKVSDYADKKSIKYLRAPVNGSVKQAEEASLVILASGKQDVYQNIYPLFEILGSKLFYVGDGEQARFLKLCINSMVGITSSMMGEALAFGEAGNLDWDTMLDIISSSAIGSPLVNFKKEILKKRDFKPTFTARQMAKDFDLILDTAKDNNLPMPLTSAVRQQWNGMIGTGRGDLDYFAYLEYLESLSGIKHTKENKQIE